MGECHYKEGCCVAPLVCWRQSCSWCHTLCRLQIRVNSLVCIGRILEHMDKWMVQEQIIPVLHQVPSREAGVLMAILGKSWRVPGGSWGGGLEYPFLPSCGS